MKKNNDLTRRAFLATTTTTAAWAITGFAAPNTAKVIPGKLSPNEKMNVAAIGSGGKGLSDIMNVSHENVVALADPDWKNAAESFARLPDAKQYKDYRIMLEKHPEIDACTISTPDHTHAPAAFMAMNMGKHVYVQKPLTHTVAEARLLRQLAKDTGVVTQMGNQGRSNNGCRDLAEMLWDGAIGEVREVHAWSNRPIWPQGMKKRPKAKDVPEHMDWDLWLGCAPERPYHPAYAPFRWRGWWDFGCGALGDMACHIMDTPNLALKLGEATTFSVEAVSQEGLTDEAAPNKSVIKYEFPARGDMPPVTIYWHDGDNLPPRPEGIPEDQEIGGGDNGSLFIGSDGFLTAGTYSGEARFLPMERNKDYKRPEQTLARVKDENHAQNWIDGCKGGDAPSSNFEYSAPFTEFVNFGNVALRAGKKLEYDRVSGKITNDTSLNHHLTKEYRKGWELPC